MSADGIATPVTQLQTTAISAPPAFRSTGAGESGTRGGTRAMGGSRATTGLGRTGAP